ncbi:butyrophilin subfamily 1 member A1-like isoform X2 [Carettochelys insculpta]
MLGARHTQARAALLTAILLLEFQLAAAESFQVLAPPGPLSAPLGGTVELRCHLSPALSAQDMQVMWSRPQLGQDVLVYRPDGSEAQGVAYQGRAELLREEMPSGSLALRLRNLTLQDEGRYLCDVQSDTFFNHATLELRLMRSGSDPQLHIDAYENKGLSVTCLSAGWYPEPSVHWKNSHGEIQSPGSARTQRSEDGLFSISSSIVLTDHSDPELTCVIRPGSPSPEKVSAILISDVFLRKGSVWPVLLYVILLICLCLVGLAASLMWRIRREKGDMNATLRDRRGRPSWKEAFLRAANVTLDPKTAHASLELSPDRKGLWNTGTRQAPPDEPERYDMYPCVLGAQGYGSGTHYWDVEVPGTGGWALGVTRASAGRKGWFHFSPEQGTWAIQLSVGQYRAVTAEWDPLHPSQSPGRIRVYLDYEGGVVGFYDADTMALIHAFTASFGGKVHPFFWLWSVGTSLRLCS